jgi:murein L,D-transpeptidase YafK
MRLLLIVLPIIILLSGMTFPNFRNVPMSYTRVREAYAEKGKIVTKTLAEHSISCDSLRIYLRAFKTEKKIELWAKNSSDSVFEFIKVFPICELSGDIGPKRRSRDLQAPEGFYRISDLNPYSKYYLSMEVNYPNASDSIRGLKGRLGNEIYIHGDCVSSGCLAMTDERIKELFIYCIEADKSGQKEIGITIFPVQLTDNVYFSLKSKYNKDMDKISLWADLKMSYDFFHFTKVPPTVKFLKDGTHEINGLTTETNLLIAGTLMTSYWPDRRLNKLLHPLYGRISMAYPSNGIPIEEFSKLVDVTVY